jgi:hypothetical protein
MITWNALSKMVGSFIAFSSHLVKYGADPAYAFLKNMIPHFRPDN